MQAMQPNSFRPGLNLLLPDIEVNSKVVPTPGPTPQLFRLSKGPSGRAYHPVVECQI